MADEYEGFVPADGAPPEPPKDEYEGFPPAGPTAGEKAGAVAQGAATGVARTSPVIGGMAAGARLGGIIPHPAGRVVGGAAGAAAGFILGDTLSDLLPFESPEKMPEGVKPYGVAGEVIGGSVAPTGTVVGAAKAGVRFGPTIVGNYVNRILDMAGKRTGAFVTSEATSAVSSGAAGGAIEAYFPDSPLARLSAEVTAGFWNPTKYIVSLGSLGYDAANRALNSMSSAGRQTRAAQILQNAVKESGEDTDLLVKLLQADPEFNLGAQTAAQKTGSPILSALEAELIRENGKFGAEAGKRASASLESIKSMMGLLRGTGDPEALKVAGELRERYFRTLIATRLQSAEREAADAARAITKDTPAARADLSRKATTILEKSLEQARAVERELWEAIPQDVPAQAGSILAKYGELRADMLPREGVSAVLENTIKDLEDGTQRVTSGFLITFRKRALALAREADQKGEINEARIFGNLAEAALEDLDKMATTPQFGAYGRTAEGYQDARTFSRELNEMYTRTFAGEAMQTGARGRDKIPPELVLRRALGTGAEGGALRFREIEEAVGFLPSKDLGGPKAAANFDTVLEIQERFLRLAASAAVDPNTGRVSPVRLGTIIRENGEILERFPEVKTDLQTALKSEKALRGFERQAKGMSTVIERHAAFTALTKYESSADAIGAALNSKTPVQDLTAILKVARRTSPDAFEGARAAIWDHVMRSSVTNNVIDLDKLRTNFYNPIRPGLPSLAQVMQKEGIMTGKEIAQANKLFVEVKKITDALDGGKGVENLVTIPPGVFDTVIRIGGAKLGTAFHGILPGKGSGSSLIAASRGSEYVRKVLEKVPTEQTRDVLIQAVLDPKFAAMLLQKPVTEAEGISLAKRMHSYLFSAGLIAAGDATNNQAP